MFNFGKNVDVYFLFQTMYDITVFLYSRRFEHSSNKCKVADLYLSAREDSCYSRHDIDNAAGGDGV